ncbi:unnamed protein product, partial [Agarophyton chilense]
RARIAATTRALRAGESSRVALTRAYAVPHAVAAVMTLQTARLLLWKLVLADELADMRASSCDSVRVHARVLFVHTQNGLGNRLRALASGLAMARATARVPVVVWESDPHLAAPFHEVLTAERNASSLQGLLYDHLIVMDRFVDWTLVDHRNQSWHAVSYMEKDGPHAKPDILMRFELPSHRPISVHHWLKNHPQQPPQLQSANATVQLTLSKPRPNRSSHLIHSAKHVYFRSAYVAKTQPKSICARSIVNRQLALLQPSADVMQIVRQIDPKSLSPAIGVHIRSRSLARDNVDVRTRCEYTRVGARVTDYWRSRSSLRVFVKKMQWAIRRKKSVKFFVASDDVAVVQALTARFGRDRILYIQRGCDDRFEGCVKYAMADLICLSKTMKIYGSNWSSFSEAAGRLGGKSVFLSGHHFGRVKGVARLWHQVQSDVYSKIDTVLKVWPSWLLLPWNRC